MLIAVTNLSTLVSHADAYNMTLIVNSQVRQHAAPAWRIVPPHVIYIKDATAPPSAALIAILDDTDQAGDLGWHTEGPTGQVYGRVFARPVIENGGGILTGELSVASVLSHEALEVIGDQTANRWADRADGSLVALEWCDPVESDSYPFTLTTAAGESLTATVSDFVCPAWFDPDAVQGPYDYLRLTSSPFEVRPTGYEITMIEGRVSQQFGARYPDWRRQLKQFPAARTARRNRQGHSG